MLVGDVPVSDETSLVFVCLWMAEMSNAAILAVTNTLKTVSPFWTWCLDDTDFMLSGGW